MSKVTIVTNGVSGGGAERVSCELASELCSRGWNVDLVTMSDDKEMYNLSDSVNRVVLLCDVERSGFIRNQFQRMRNLKRYIQKSETDIYIVFLPYTTILLLFFRRIIKQPIIVTERSNPSRYSLFIRIILKQMSKSADGFVFQTEYAKNWYSHSTLNKKAEIIPNSVNNDFIGDNMVNVDKKDRIIAVGRLHECKNYRLLINAFSDICQQYPSFELVIYGDGNDKNKLLEQIEELKLTERVHLGGFVENVKTELLRSKIYVMTSNYEGMPNSLIEAMACGLPCISTDFDGGGARDIIRNGDNGILVPIGDREEIAKAMSQLIESEELSERLSKKAFEIREMLSPEIIYDKWETLIKWFTEGNRVEN